MFKYLMEDERIAKTILSALLKMDHHPFVDSLTHDSIIVQIPRLRGLINRSASGNVHGKSRLDMVLSIFDQSHLDGKNKQMLEIDESLYSDDADMLHIVHRLLAAASDSRLRHDMNVEDEYYSAIEKRDTDILIRDKQLAEKNATIKEKEDTIKEKEDTIKLQETMLSTTIKMLMNAGMALDQIAASLGVNLDTVTRLARQKE